MGNDLDNSVTAAGSTPVGPRLISLPLHLNPVDNCNLPVNRSRLSGRGGSPTEFLRDYLSGVRGQEEGDEEDEVEEEGVQVGSERPGHRATTRRLFVGRPAETLGGLNANSAAAGSSSSGEEEGRDDVAFPIRSVPSADRNEAAGKEKIGGRQDAKLRRQCEADKLPAAPALLFAVGGKAGKEARADRCSRAPRGADDDEVAGGKGAGEIMDGTEERRERYGGPGERRASPPPPLSAPEGGRKNNWGAMLLSVYGGI